jgi:uncharacterized membrane protein
MAESSEQTALGVSSNVGGLICYVPCCVGLIFSIVAVIMEKQSKFLRFHAFQSLLLHAVIIVFSVALTIVGIVLSMAHLGCVGLVLTLFRVVFGLGFLGLCVFLMIKAHGGEETSLPVIGSLAKSWA